ncbi:hypothetical protein D3C71_2182000 [compost metagenome]
MVEQNVVREGDLTAANGYQHAGRADIVHRIVLDSSGRHDQPAPLDHLRHGGLRGESHPVSRQSRILIT